MYLFSYLLIIEKSNVNIMIFDSNVTTTVLGTVNLILNSHISSVFISNKQLILDFIHLFLSEYYNHVALMHCVCQFTITSEIDH